MESGLGLGLELDWIVMIASVCPRQSADWIASDFEDNPSLNSEEFEGFLHTSVSWMKFPEIFVDKIWYYTQTRLICDTEVSEYRPKYLDTCYGSFGSSQKVHVIPGYL